MNKITDYTKEDIIEIPEVLQATIYEIEIINSKEAFGDKAVDKDKDVLKITYVNEELNITNHFYMTYFAPGTVHPKSRLGKFLAKYGELKVGVKIKLVLNGDYYEPLI